MYAPLARSEYYGASVPPHGPRSDTDPPRPRTGGPRPGATARRFPRSLLTDRPGRHPAVPRQPRRGYAADIHHGLRHRPNDSIPETTASFLKGGRALHTDPYPPGWSRHNSYGASDTDSLTLYLLALIAEPAPSGSTGTSRRCRGCSHPPRRSPAQAAPIFSQTAATARRRRSPTSARSNSASWRTIR
jgi:hypothetical protein